MLARGGELTTGGRIYERGVECEWKETKAREKSGKKYLKKKYAAKL